MSTYRLISLMLDPFIDLNIVVGAIVQLRKGLVFVKSPRVPCDDCLVKMGAANTLAFLRMCLKEIEDECTLGIMPRKRRLGQAWTIRDRRHVPQGVVDPVEWVRKLLGPQEYPT